MDEWRRFPAADDDHPDRRDPLKRFLRPLEPETETVRRVVTAALAAAHPGKPATRRWPWLAAAVLLALLGTLLWLRPSPSQEPPLPPPPSVAVLTITNKGGPVTIQTPAGAQLVVLSGGNDVDPQNR